MYEGVPIFALLHLHPGPVEHVEILAGFLERPFPQEVLTVPIEAEKRACEFGERFTIEALFQNIEDLQRFFCIVPIAACQSNVKSPDDQINAAGSHDVLLQIPGDRISVRRVPSWRAQAGRRFAKGRCGNLSFHCVRPFHHPLSLEGQDLLWRLVGLGESRPVGIARYLGLRIRQGLFR